MFASGKSSHPQLLSFALAALVPLLMDRGVLAQCAWLPGDGVPGVDGGILDTVYWDPDGSGPLGDVLVVAGDFTMIADTPAENIATWNGSTWAPVGPGLPGWNVSAVTVFDDGSGPTLWAAYNVPDYEHYKNGRIAKWNGWTWTEVGPAFDEGVSSLRAFDSGQGEVLYVGGRFKNGGTQQVDCIARWDGNDWLPVGAPLTGLACDVRELVVFDDGTGPALIAGGNFGGPCNDLAKWDGTNWSCIGSPNSAVYALEVANLGDTTKLYVGGAFTSIGGVSARRVAAWDGDEWNALGVGVSDVVYGLGTHDDGSGIALYVGGEFTEVNGNTPANYIAKWDGLNWYPLGTGLQGTSSTSAHEFATIQHQGSSKLLVGGGFRMAGGIHMKNAAIWDGAAWSALGTGTDGDVLAFTVFDDGDGPALFAGGEFGMIGGVLANRIAKWDGVSWSALGSGIGTEDLDEVLALAVFDDGNGPALYAGGRFATAGGIPASNIAKWDGSGWSAVGGGADSRVYALQSFDDGAGPALFVGGVFNHVGGILADRVAKWNGVSWTSLAWYMGGAYAFTVFDDGTGPALIMGGSFGRINDNFSVENVAKWDGTAWNPLGAGLEGNHVYALVPFDDGSGLTLFAGGEFKLPGTNIQTEVAKWDQSGWTNFWPGTTNREVLALSVFDGGGGSSLYAAGTFTNVGGVLANRIVRWSDSAWSALGLGFNEEAYALQVFDDGSGPALYAGGHFTAAGGVASAHVARWKCGLSDLDSDGVADLGDNCPSVPNPGQENCDGYGTGDACVVADCNGSPTCADCNGNGVPDGCELVAGAVDQNGNLVPDECEPGACCSIDWSCENVLPSRCIGGIWSLGANCDPNPCAFLPESGPLGGRYLSVVLNPSTNPETEVAIRVTCQQMPSMVKYVVPDAGLAQLGDSAVTMLPSDWGKVDIVDEELVPGWTYLVALEAGIATSGSIPHTLREWGDVTEPWGSVSFADIAAAVGCFQQSAGLPQLGACDIAPAVPDRTVSFLDISSVVGAFRGGSYPYEMPGS